MKNKVHPYRAYLSPKKKQIRLIPNHDSPNYQNVPVQVNFDKTNAARVPKLTQCMCYTEEFIISRFTWLDATVSVASKTGRCSEGSLYRGSLYPSLPVGQYTFVWWFEIAVVSASHADISYLLSLTSACGVISSCSNVCCEDGISDCVFKSIWLLWIFFDPTNTKKKVWGDFTLYWLQNSNGWHVVYWIC